MKLKAELVRGDTIHTENYIKVTRDNGEIDLFGGIIEHCAKDLSPNELRKTWIDCEAQIKKLGPERTPKAFNEMFNDLKRAMKNRGVSFEEPIPSITIVITLNPWIRKFIKTTKQLFSTTKRRVKSFFTRVGVYLNVIETKEVKEE